LQFLGTLLRQRVENGHRFLWRTFVALSPAANSRPGTRWYYRLSIAATSQSMQTFTLDTKSLLDRAGREYSQTTQGCEPEYLQSKNHSCIEIGQQTDG
jgi:hypothetical protein